MDRMRPNWTKQDQRGQTGTKWSEQNQCGLNRTEVDKMDEIEPKWTNGRNRTKVNKWTEQDQSEPNGPNRTEMDQIRPKWTK